MVTDEVLDKERLHLLLQCEDYVALRDNDFTPCYNHGNGELLRLEKTSNIMESDC